MPKIIKPTSIKFSKEEKSFLRRAARAQRHGHISKVIKRLVIAEMQREAVYTAACVLHARSGQGVTLDEVSASLQVPPNRISGRISELVHEGVLVPTGARRRTRAGCAAKVYAPAHERGRG